MTAQSLITGALTDIGVIAAGQTPSDDENTYALALLNATVDMLSAEETPIPELTKSTVSLSGAASYTISPRPLRVLGASISASGITVPVDIVPSEIWAQGGGTAARPHMLYDHGTTMGSAYLRPSPGGGTLELLSLAALNTFSELSSSVTFPPGYEMALRRILGLQLAEGFGRTVSEGLMLLAAEAKKAICDLNTKNLGTGVPAVAPTGA